MAEVRKIFIYLTILAVILAAIGIINLTRNLSRIPGLAVQEEKSFSIEEISLHSTEKNCWISFDGGVYDVTLFLQIYDGVLNDKCGKILNDLSFLDKNTREILKEYEIGNLK